MTIKSNSSYLTIDCMSQIADFIYHHFTHTKGKYNIRFIFKHQDIFPMYCGEHEGKQLGKKTLPKLTGITDKHNLRLILHHDHQTSKQPTKNSHNHMNKEEEAGDCLGLL